MTDKAMDTDIVSDLQDGATVEGAEVATPQSRPENTATSLRDQISSALKGEGDTPAAASQDGVQAPAKQRDAAGRFVGQDGAATPSDPNAQQPAGDTVPPQQPAAVRPPAGIDPTIFNALPAEAQQHVAQTIEALSARAALVDRYADYESLIAPRRQAYALNGMTEGQALSQLFALSDFATQDPKGFIKYFAHGNQIDLEELFYGDESDHEYVDPQLAAVTKQVSDLQQQLQLQQQQQQQQQHSRMVDYVLNYFQAKDANGAPLRPHVDELGSTLTTFVQSVKASNPQYSMDQILSEAYEAACWAHPSVRAKMQQAHNAAQEAQRLKDATERARKAQSAGVSVAGGVAEGGTPASTGDGTIRGAIEAAMAKVGS